MNIRVSRRAALLSTALWAVATLARGEQAAAGGADGEELEGRGELVEYVEVRDSSLPTSNTIATKLEQPLQLTPANVGTVGPALIYEQDARLLGDALENVSGLNIQNGSGVHEFFAIRGFDSVSSGLIMTDGTAEPEVSYYQTYNVRGVEVFKGPAGFLYGRNPLAGAVNIVRKQPLAGDFVIVNGSTGSFATNEGRLDWNRFLAGAGLSFRLNGLWRESDQYRDDKASRHVAVNPSVALELGPDSSLNFNLELVEADYSPDGGIPLVGNAVPRVSRKRSYQPFSDYSDQSIRRFQVDYERRLSDRVRLRNKLYYRELDWQSDGALLQGTLPANPQAPWLNPGEVQVIRDLGVLDDRQRFLGNQLEALFSLSSGPVEHELLVGLEVVRETDDYSFDIEPLGDVELGSLGAIDPIFDIGVPQTLNSVGDVTNEIVAPYVIDQMRLSSKVRAVLGARYDHIDTEGDVTSLLVPLPLSYSRDDSELSPMAGLIVAPSESLSFYGNAARSYAPPSTRLVDDLGPAGREPEKGTQYEVGVKKLFGGGKVRTTLAVYRLERERIAIADGTGFTQQTGDQRSRGVELELAAEPLPRLRTFFSYAYTDAELTSFRPFVQAVGNFVDYSGNTPIMAPEHLANLWVSRSFRGGLGLSGGARYVGEQFISEDNVFAIDSYVVLDAAVFFDTDRWRLKLNLKNITDEEYQTRGIAGASSVIPADPFAVYAGIELRM